MPNAAKTLVWMSAAAFLSAGLLLGLRAPAQEAPVATMDAEGTIHSAPITLPPSDFLSPQAKVALTERMRAPRPTGTVDGAEITAKASLDGWLKIYPSKIEDTSIDGVHVFIVTPTAGV